LGALVLSGCAVGPDYEAPEVPVPDAWQSAAVEGLSTGTATLQTWWSALDDPILEGLVQRAQESNLTLQEATARVQEARAILGLARAGRVPDFAVGGSTQRFKGSDNSQLGQIAPNGLQTTNLFDLGVGASWEVDLFGRVRRSVEAADATFEASIEDYRDVLVSLFAEVARSYIDLRTTQTRLKYAEQNIEAQRASFSLTQVMFKEGATAALDVAQAESNLRNSEAAIPQLHIAFNFAVNRLAVLLGETPGSLTAELVNSKPIPSPPEDVAAGIPADLLRQRADVRRAERLLASQTARIGVATAELYPRFSLTGFFGFQSTDFDSMFDSASQTWGVSLPFRWLIFDGGRVRSFIDIEEARAEQQLARYELTLLVAYEEVENALVAYALEQYSTRSFRQAADASRKAVNLVELQYKSGLTDFQNFLDMQRVLFRQEDQLAVSEGQVMQNLISLYTALGGGWDPDSLPIEQAN
jgi:NodT family efflux transporter outer membrane factor (OMF) lipoprotein